MTSACHVWYRECLILKVEVNCRYWVQYLGRNQQTIIFISLCPEWKQWRTKVIRWALFPSSLGVPENVPMGFMTSVSVSCTVLGPFSAEYVLLRFTFCQAPSWQLNLMVDVEVFPWKPPPSSGASLRCAGVPSVKGCLVNLEGWPWPPTAMWCSAVSHSLTCSVSGLLWAKRLGTPT